MLSTETFIKDSQNSTIKKRIIQLENGQKAWRNISSKNTEMADKHMFNIIIH